MRHPDKRGDHNIPKREFDLIPLLPSQQWHHTSKPSPSVKRLILCFMNSSDDGIDSPSQTSLSPNQALIQSSSSKRPKAWLACLVWNILLSNTKD